MAPLATALVAYAVLAAVRIAGAFEIPFTVLSIALTPCVLAAVPRRLWPEIGLKRPQGWPLVLGVSVVVAVYADVIACNWAAFGSTAGNWTTGIPKLFRDLVPGMDVLAAVVMVLAMGVLVPLVEEVCYRGVLFAAVQRHLGVVPAVVLTSAGWAMVHLGNYGLNPLNGEVVLGVLPSVFCMGLALGFCRAVTGSAIASAIAQGTANLLLVAWVV
jgi:membrane protease YdiL (CAAX protease family)